MGMLQTCPSALRRSPPPRAPPPIEAPEKQARLCLGSRANLGPAAISSHETLTSQPPSFSSLPTFVVPGNLIELASPWLTDKTTNRGLNSSSASEAAAPSCAWLRKSMCFGAARVPRAPAWENKRSRTAEQFREQGWKFSWPEGRLRASDMLNGRSEYLYHALELRKPAQW